MSLDMVMDEDVPWDSLPLTVEFARELSATERAALVDLIENWYADGSCGAFGGPLHSMDPVGFHKHAKGVQTAEWEVDMGSADESALQELAQRLDTFGTLTRTQPRRLIVGPLYID